MIRFQQQNFFKLVLHLQFHIKTKDLTKTKLKTLNAVFKSIEQMLLSSTIKH